MTNLQDQDFSHADPLYFLDYVFFTGWIRNYAADMLEKTFKANPTLSARPLHFVNLLKEEYAAYEDLGAMLLCFIEYRKRVIHLPFKGLMNYTPGDAKLNKIFDKYSITSANILYETLRLSEWIPNDWASWFPKINLEKVLKSACDFFFNDCRQNQKILGIKAYNKIKHGLLVVPLGKRYAVEAPNGPAALIIKNGRVTVYGYNPTDDQIESRHRSIHFIQKTLRIIAALYIASRYPDFLKERGFPNVKYFFEHKSLSDLLEFMIQITIRK